MVNRRLLVPLPTSLQRLNQGCADLVNIAGAQGQRDIAGMHAIGELPDDLVFVGDILDL
jgi:hypothetical protein